MNKLLQGFIDLGLDLETGVSGEITVEEIEALTGTKVTGNGSKVREDSNPWDKFMIRKSKEGSSIVSFRFLGYRTVEFQRGVIFERMHNRRQRLEGELSKISEDKALLRELDVYSTSTQVMFNKGDL